VGNEEAYDGAKSFALHSRRRPWKIEATSIVAWCTPTAVRQCSAAGMTLEDSAASRPDGNSTRPVCIIRACSAWNGRRKIPNLIAIR